MFSQFFPLIAEYHLKLSPDRARSQPSERFETRAGPPRVSIMAFGSAASSSRAAVPDGLYRLSCAAIFSARSVR